MKESPRKTPLTKEERRRIKDKFAEYKYSKVTLKNIAKELNLDKSTVGKHFKNYFGEEYSSIAKKKSYQHAVVLSQDKLLILFKKYRDGKNLVELSSEAGIGVDSLRHRMLRVFGTEYRKISEKRFRDRMSKIKRRVSKLKIKKAFNKYKNTSASLTTLGEDLGLAESSLISRFKREFNEEYEKISLARRDERKATKDQYVKAFGEYETTDVSLTELAKKLNVRISTLRSRFLNLFGKKYLEVAAKKQDGNTLNKKGNDSEFLAKKYFEILGIEVWDVREKAILKGTLKRPDFLLNNAFVEVKSYFVRMSHNLVKGYSDIISDYMDKETKDGIILRRGIIISLNGFSDNVKLEAEKDNVILVDPQNMLKTFRKAKREDLIHKLETLAGKVEF